MKKWIFVGIIVALVLGGWWAGRTYWRITPVWDQPKYGEVTRGDIRVPVTATGLIEPEQRVEVKPEASGRVKQVLVKPGDYVHTGDTLILLDPEDETRNVERATAARDRASASLERAKVAVLTAQANELTSAARLDELKANRERLNFDLKKQRELSKESRAADRDLMVAETAVKINDAQQVAGDAAIVTARHNVTDAGEAVKIADAALREAVKTLEEAQKRLRDTNIVSRVDGIVTDVRVEIGFVVQSGTSTFGGGSILAVIADVSKVKVVTRVDDADYGRVSDIAPIEALPERPNYREDAAKDTEQLLLRSGEVKITVDAFPERVFAGKIERVEPQGKLNTGSSVIQFDVHVEITDPDVFLLPLGTQAQVEFTVESVKDALLVPAEAVKTKENDKVVWVDAPPPAGEQWGKKPIRCRFGITDGVNTHVVEVLDGEKLEPGKRVYTKLPVDREQEAK